MSIVVAFIKEVGGDLRPDRERWRQGTLVQATERQDRSDSRGEGGLEVLLQRQPRRCRAEEGPFFAQPHLDQRALPGIRI